MAIGKIIRDGKKFMWDGKVYASESEAANAASAYAKDGFETCIERSEASYKVYTRRKATPPPTPAQP